MRVMRALARFIDRHVMRFRPTASMHFEMRYNNVCYEYRQDTIVLIMIILSIRLNLQEMEAALSIILSLLYTLTRTVHFCH